MSQDTVYISSQYLALPDNTRKALINAAARGVDVRILTNSYETGLEVAFSLCHYISLNYYAELLQSGVRIYEYKCSEDLEKKPYYHAKYFIIDGKWTSIGSFNLSVRSAYIESELQVNIPDCQRAFENLPNVGVKNLPLLHLGFIILLFLPLRACL
jgi:phosphatidylserine/phosphatidylglycerophosphate/cardiolipin synthase-like enzyme